MLDHLRDLAREPSSRLAEHMVSALLGFALNLDREAEVEFQRRLVTVLEKAASAAALLYLRTVADQAPPGWDLAGGIRELSGAGVRPPEWGIRPPLAFLGAWKGTEPLGDQDLIILGFHSQGERAESFQVMIDHNLELLKDALLLPIPPTELIAAWQERTDEIKFRPIAAQQASNEIAAALAQSDQLWVDPPWTDDFRAHRGLLRSRLRLLPMPDLPTPAEQPSEEARQAIVTKFMSSPEATALQDRSLSEIIAGRFVDFRIDLGDGEVFRWSPIVVEMLLVDWYPRKALPDMGEVEHVPEVLHAWIRYAGRRRKLPEPLIQETLDAIPQWLAEFKEAMADHNRFGPAKAIVAAMKADGVEIGDAEAMRRWMDDFNRRPFEERAGIIPGPPAAG